MIKDKIFLLVDCEGEVVCAFTNEKTALEEAEESGGTVELTTLYGDQLKANG